MSETKDFKQLLKEEMENVKNFDLADINNLDWNNMGSWPLIGRGLFLLLVFVLILVVGYMLLLKDKQETLTQKQNQEQQLRQEYKSKVFKVANIEQYRRQMDEVQKNLYKLLEQLPLAKEIPGLIDDISRSAFEGGLELKSIDPKTNIARSYYLELPINIRVSGGYHELATFVSNVSALPRIVTLHDFNITRAANSNLLNMQVTAKTYQYKEGKKQ